MSKGKIEEEATGSHNPFTRSDCKQCLRRKQVNIIFGVKMKCILSAFRIRHDTPAIIFNFLISTESERVSHHMLTSCHAPAQFCLLLNNSHSSYQSLKGMLCIVHGPLFCCDQLCPHVSTIINSLHNDRTRETCKQHSSQLPWLIHSS